MTRRFRAPHLALEQGFAWLAAASAALVLVLGLAAMALTALALPALAVLARQPGPGLVPAVLGTLACTAAAAAMAVPPGVLGAVYLHEYGGGSRFARLLRFLASVMTGVPSIVMGLVAYVAWTVAFGPSARGAALALACLMLPVVIGATEQVLQRVPGPLREAAYTLGATRSRTILTVVLPAALPGIASAALLAVGRAAGEAAPLLFTVAAALAYDPRLSGEARRLQLFGDATASCAAALALVLLAFAAILLARVLGARLAFPR